MKKLGIKGRAVRYMGCALVVWTAAASAGAQSPTTATTAVERGVSSQVTPSDKKKPAYSKRVGGTVWLEGTAGFSWFDVNKLRKPSPQMPSFSLTGGELGGALKFRVGSATIGGHFKIADYEPFDLMTAGLGFGFMIRAVPHIHPTFRFALNYHTTSRIEPLGIDGLVVGARAQGAGASVGVGLRIPIVRWVSIAADFDYSVIALGLGGAGTPGGGFFDNASVGTAISASLALTIHLGG